MKGAIVECALLLTVIAAAEPAFARSYLHCLTKKVVILAAPSGSTSSGIDCSGVLVATNRMFALVTASRMAPASAMKLSLRLSAVQRCHVSRSEVAESHG